MFFEPPKTRIIDPPSISGRTNLLLGGGLGEVGEGLAALELGVLDHTWKGVVLGWCCGRYVL